MKMGSVFAGIGGFELGMSRAGMQPAWSIEIDDWCCKVLRKNFNHRIINSDVRECGKGRKHELSPVDIICAGFPCQPFSNAGKRGGVNDNRYLWPETLRLIDEFRPAWFVGENVAGLLSMVNPSPISEWDNLGMESQTHFKDSYHRYVYRKRESYTIDQICQSLEEIGYTVQPFVIPAAAVEAFHRRDRVWILAHDDTKYIDLGGLQPFGAAFEQAAALFGKSVPIDTDDSNAGLSTGTLQGESGEKRVRQSESVGEFGGTDQTRVHAIAPDHSPNNGLFTANPGGKSPGQKNRRNNTGGQTRKSGTVDKSAVVSSGDGPIDAKELGKRNQFHSDTTSERRDQGKGITEMQNADSGKSSGDAGNTPGPRFPKWQSIPEDARKKFQALIRTGREPWPEIATRLCRESYEISGELDKLAHSDRTRRLEALGNAVVPQIPQIIGEYIRKIEQLTNHNNV